MTLQLKTLAIVGALLTIFIFVVSYSSRRILLNRFEQQEERQREIRMNMLRGFLHRELRDLDEDLGNVTAAQLDTPRRNSIIKKHRLDVVKPLDPEIVAPRRLGIEITDDGIFASRVIRVADDGQSYVVSRKIDMPEVLADGVPVRLYRIDLRRRRNEFTYARECTDLGLFGTVYAQFSPTDSILHSNRLALARASRIVIAVGTVAVVAFLLFLQYAVLHRISNLHTHLREFRLGRVTTPPSEDSQDDLGGLARETRELVERNRTLSRDLSHSERCFKAFVAEHPGLICRFDKDGRLTYVSDVYADYYGRTRSELIGKPVWHNFAPGSRHEVEEYLKQNPTPDTQEFECQALTGDEELRRQHWRWDTILDDNVNVIEYQAVGQDITEQWQAQDELNRQRELEKLLLEVSTDLINLPPADVDEGINYVLKSIGEYVSADHAFVCFYDKDDRGMRRRHLWRRDPDAIPSVEEQVLDLDKFPWLQERLQRGETVRVLRLSQLSKNAPAEHDFFERVGVKSFMAVPIQRERILSGIMVFESTQHEENWQKELDVLLSIAAEMVVNAIGRRDAVRTLEQNEQRLRQILGAVQTGIFVIRLSAREIADVNDQACELVGIPREDLVGSLCMRVFESLPAMPGTPREGLCWNVEDKIKTQSGGRLPVLRTTVSVMLGGELHLIESVVNLTNQKRLETERMQNERLQGVLEMAGATCHELNQPLQVITGYTELLLLKAKKDDPNYSKLRLLHEQARKLAQITQKINNITTYETQDYLNGKIIDINKSVSPEKTQTFAMPADRVNTLLAEVIGRKKEKDDDDSEKS